MIKYLALLTGFGLACLSFPGDSAAQELAFPTANTASIPGMPASQNHNGPSFGGAVVVLPVPLSADGTSGPTNPYGFQYPGSYMPRDTPLHRFNGYVVCDPPNNVNGANGGTSSKPARAPVAQRVVKITTTRSLAAPGYLQPCPIYTINGEIQNNNGYTARSSR